MIYNILSKLFARNEFENEYRVRHSHLVYSILIMAVGTYSWFYPGWEMFGTLLLILGFGLGISILICVNWDKVIDYWDTLNEHIRLMNKSNPDIWVALGYSKPATSVQVIEQEDKGQGFITTRIRDLPISPTQMNMVANKFLGSGSTDLPEQIYGNIIPNFRLVRKQWIKEGILVPKNKKNVRSGYCVSRKGLNMMYQFASEHMKLKE